MQEIPINEELYKELSELRQKSFDIPFVIGQIDIEIKELNDRRDKMFVEYSANIDKDKEIADRILKEHGDVQIDFEKKVFLKK